MGLSPGGRFRREGQSRSFSLSVRLRTLTLENDTQSAAHNHTFAYSNSPSQQEKEKDSFGVETRGQMMLVEYSKFDEVVSGMEGFLGGME